MPSKGSRAPKRDSACPPTQSFPPANGHGFLSSPSPVPAKRNCSLALGGSRDQVALPEHWEDKDGFKFHVYQRNGVRICDDFLLGSCSQGESCPLHHVRYPYHWQLKQKESRAWQSVSNGAQQHLEKLYSDISNVQVTLVDKTIPKMPREEFQLSAFGIPGEDPTDEYCVPYPAALLFPSACPMFVQLEIQPLEAAFRSTWSLFHESLSENKALVLAIHRIWNEALWQNYIRKKKSMSEALSGMKKYQLEKHLFYGTWAERSSPICRMNFDPCLSGLFAPIYGQGIYFHVGAEQAHQHTLPDKDGLRYMFLAKVLVGRHISGEQHYRPSKTLLPAQETYESRVDNLENPEVFVTFGRSQCYPYFLICYKLTSDSVALGI